MRSVVACTVLVALSPLPAYAVCAVEPLGPELRAADVVYVGTVVRSELTAPLPSSAAAEQPRQRRIGLRHTVQPEIILKGDPATAPAVFSAWKYNPPKSRQTVIISELSAVLPGDTLLVVAHHGQPTYFGLCSATREWNAESAGVVRAVLTPAPGSA
ncbi:hypothetical protein GCM10008101_28270 [Lysobacter xinjiangensis]|uniref:Uncharacterized protein n=1 Tax=Cognatilysobacter xinjiangensis TaxID=546892 RepID=A0ABQ3C7J4_9GAMM|nr:hypothetical protein GCM10008101_28270 [Lysobacter xinjiangensis]